MSIRFVLTTDGNSDRVLIPILNWLIETNTQLAPEVQWADPAILQSNKFRDLQERILNIQNRYHLDILFIHRDAEAQPPEWRRDEVERACEGKNLVYMCVIPVRMTEAWLLFNEQAIRRAACNPNGKIPLNLPTIRRCEEITDPKQRLKDAMEIAHEHVGRRRMEDKDIRRAIQDIPDYIDDFSPLRQLPAFQQLEDDFRKTIQKHWPKYLRY